MTTELNPSARASANILVAADRQAPAQGAFPPGATLLEPPAPTATCWPLLRSAGPHATTSLSFLLSFVPVGPSPPPDQSSRLNVRTLPDLMSSASNSVSIRDDNGILRNNQMSMVLGRGSTCSSRDGQIPHHLPQTTAPPTRPVRTTVTRGRATYGSRTLQEPSRTHRAQRSTRAGPPAYYTYSEQDFCLWR